jgi:hypothetical protein
VSTTPAGNGAPGPEAIVLTLVPLRSDRPVEVRLRQLLKHALRAQQLKCVRIGAALPMLPNRQAKK